MASALFTFLAPLQMLVDWLTTRPQPRTSSALLATRNLHPTLKPACMRRPVRPVRVVRLRDPAHGHAAPGRMLISGRMSDVCAALDRLAALEAAGG